MILYGRDLSPYTRRVAIWMSLQGRAFERRPLALTEPADFEAVIRMNPLGRVPVLELDDGTLLTESWAICDWLDDDMPDRRLTPATGLARRETLQRIALAQGATDKVVALVYDQVRRPAQFHYAPWIERLEGQVTRGLAALDAAAPETGFFGGDAPDGADIATVCAFEMAAKMHPALVGDRHPRLAAHASRAGEIAAFADTRP